MNKLKGVFGLWKLNDRRSAPAQRRARSLFAGALLFAAMFMYVPPAQAHCPVFGPKVYTRPPGKAVVTQNDSFGASILEGTFTLIIDNGTAAGGSRVTRGSIVQNRSTHGLSGVLSTFSKAENRRGDEKLSSGPSDTKCPLILATL